MIVTDEIGINQFIDLLKTFVPEFNSVPDSVLQGVKEPHSYMPISMCNVLELSISKNGYVPKETFGAKTRETPDNFTIIIDINSSSEKLVRYAQSNNIENVYVIKRVLKFASDDIPGNLIIPEEAHLEYEPGVWIMAFPKKNDCNRLPGTCRFEVDNDTTAIMFSENNRSYKIHNPKPDGRGRKPASEDDISWDILFNISEDFTKYLYHLPVERFAINDKGQHIEVYVKTASVCRPPVDIPNGWSLFEANDTIFKFRHKPVQPVVEQLKRAIACLAY